MTKKKRNKWNTVLIQSINKEIKNRYFVVTLFRKSVYLFESVVFDVEKKKLFDRILKDYSTLKGDQISFGSWI